MRFNGHLGRDSNLRSGHIILDYVPEPEPTKFEKVKSFLVTTREKLNSFLVSTKKRFVKFTATTFTPIRIFIILISLVILTSL